MDIVKFTWPDSSVSYQILDMTAEERTALAAAPDPTAWIATNGTVVSTMTAGAGGGPAPAEPT